MRSLAPSLSTTFITLPSTNTIFVDAIPRVPVIQRSSSSLTPWMARRRSRPAESRTIESRDAIRAKIES